MIALSELKYPIMQAPIGSACSLELASAVTNVGALGCIALTWHSPTDAVNTVRQLQNSCEGLFAVNYVCAFSCPSMEAVLAEGVPIITLSWGMPAKQISRIKAAGTTLGIQVGSVEGAQLALDMGADFLICQGVEAGGHVQSSVPLMTLLSQVMELDRLAPVVAAGGIANAQDVTRVIGAGASIAALGTRFVNAHESKAHVLYQQAIANSREADAVLTPCFDGDWPYSSVRALRNRTLVDWEANGCPPVGQRPGEGDVVATTASGWDIPRYHIASPVNTTQGDVLDLALYAGSSCERVNDIQNAQDIVKSLCHELCPTAIDKRTLTRGIR